jgi:putative ABC transport system permease protein
VFSVVSTLLLHPVAYPHADRIVEVYQQPTSGNNTGISVSIRPAARVVRAWQGASRSVEMWQGYTTLARAMKTAGDPSPVTIGAVFPTFAAFAGERPIVGRMFDSSETANGAHLVLLGESIWRQRFGADRTVLGKMLMLGDSSYQIIGVLPATLVLPGTQAKPTDMWIPLNVNNDTLGMSVVARLRRGVQSQDVARELDSIFVRSAGFREGKTPAFATMVVRPAERLRFRDSLILLTWAVAAVLLVACANVAHLVLARAASRQRELAIRATLGAGRSRILRQLLAEAGVLAAAGTAGGVLLGAIGLRALVALRPRSLDALRVAHLDGTTLAVALSIAVACTVLFGIAGGLRSTRQPTHEAIKATTGAASASRGQQRARELLVVTEMGMSALLIIGALLLVRSVRNLQTSDLGFQPKGLYALSIPFGEAHIDAPEARAGVLRDLVTRVRALPGVQSVAVAGVPPGWFSFRIGVFEIEGSSAPPSTATSFVSENTMQNEYIRTMGIRLIGGSLFTDTTTTSRQVLVNASFARKTWPSGDAVGHRIRVGSEDWHTIVGVVADARTGGPLTESTAPTLYLPPATRDVQALMIRTSRDAASLRPVVAMLRAEGLHPTSPPESVEQVIAQSIAATRFVMLLLTCFTVMALVLAAVGLYGVLSYRVAQTTREIGIRVALGATAGRVGRAIVSRGVSLALLGAGSGVTAAVWGTKVIEHQLYGVSRLDPSTFVAGAVVLVAIAALACIVPTRRALAIDPASAIRAD